MYAAPSTPSRHPLILRPCFSFTRIVPWLALFMCFFAINAFSQTTLLLGLTNTVWRYDTNGTELHGTGWEQDDFDDTSWPEGRALLSVEDNAAIIPLIGTRLSLFVPGSATVRVTSFWFRVHFNMPQDPVALGSSLSLIVSNFIDDGYLMYINGTEVDRYNMPGTPGMPDVLASTQGTAANPGGDGVPIVRNIGNPPSLRQNDNVLAVEVHQSGNTSSDVVWGTAIFSSLAFGPTITNQPQATNILEGRSGTLSVAATGFPIPTYQWFFDNGGGAVALLNEINQTHTITNMTMAKAGNYFVRVSGAGPAVDSTVVAVGFIPDIIAPVPLSATWTNDETILLTFDEPVPASTVENPSVVDDAFTYELDGVLGSVNSVDIVNGTNVVLHIGAPRDPTHDYFLDIEAGQDPYGNFIDPVPITLPVLLAIPVVDFHSTWRFDQSGVDRGTTWKDSGYNDSAWNAGQGILAQETAGGSVALIRTDLQSPTEGGPNTIYFRANFVAPALADTVGFEIWHFVDDAAVVFINGQEAYRSTTPDLAPGQTFASQADFAQGDAAIEGPFFIPTSNIVAGVNLITVEVHQNGTASSDVVWGARLNAIVSRAPLGAPSFLSQPQPRLANEGSNVWFQAQAWGQLPITYQWRKGGVAILNATNDTLVLTNIGTADVALYDVVATSAAGSVDSSDAQLTLRPELAVQLLPNGDVQLTWSAAPEWDLVESTSVLGPYTPVAGDPGSGYTVTPTGTKFYQLQKP